MIGFTRKFGRLASAVAVVALCAGTLQAQTAPSGNDGLDIPQDLAILQGSTLDSRRPVATVNGMLITGTDIEHRVALAVNVNELQVTPEEMPRLRMQILRALIDETIQLQEAKAQEMPVDQAEIDQTFQRIAAERFGRTPEQMTQFLASAGSSAASLKRQIEGELSMDRLVRRNIVPFVSVSQDEAKELYDRLEATKGSTEYRIGEIYLSATPATDAAVREKAAEIVSQLREGGSFVAFARQYSEASTAAVGGDLGWIQIAQLQNPQLEAVATDMQPGQLAGPIPIPGGYSIMFMIDRRQIGMADPRDAVLSLKQISLDFSKGTTEQAASQQLEGFGQMLQKITSCDLADSMARSIGATTVDNTAIALRSLPEALQSALVNLQVGQATPPFGSLDEGVRVLMLCGREMPEAGSGPSLDQLQNQLEEERVNRRTQSYLRDLRRDAVIDYN